MKCTLFILATLLSSTSMAATPTEPSFAKDANGSVLYLALKDAQAYCARQQGRLPDIRELASLLYRSGGLRATSRKSLLIDTSEMDIKSVKEPLRSEIERNKTRGYICQTMYENGREFCGFFYNPRAYLRPRDLGIPTSPQAQRDGTDQKVDDGTFAWSTSIDDNGTGVNWVISLYGGQITGSSTGQYNPATETFHGAVRCVR